MQPKIPFPKVNHERRWGFIVPITVICRASKPARRFVQPADTTLVMVDGVVLGDATGVVLRDNADEAVVRFTGSCMLQGRDFAEVMQRVRESEVEFIGGALRGRARDVMIEIGSVVTRVDPKTGDTWNLVGADR